MTLGQNQPGVGKFYRYQSVEQTDLSSVSCPIEPISTVANAEYEVLLAVATTEPLVDGPAAPPRGAITGSMVGAICGCLAGLGILAVPGIGLGVAVGTTATTLIMTLAGTGMGVACGGLIDALSSVEPAAEQVKR